MEEMQRFAKRDSQADVNIRDGVTSRGTMLFVYADNSGDVKAILLSPLITLTHDKNEILCSIRQTTS